jgi:hypothetical protein
MPGNSVYFKSFFFDFRGYFIYRVSLLHKSYYRVAYIRVLVIVVGEVKRRKV